jgi:hypothetical protein
MNSLRKPLQLILTICLFLAFVLPVQAESVTGEVYSDIEIVDIPVTIKAGNALLTVTFPKKITDDVEADSFELTIQAGTESFSTPVALAGGGTGNLTYTFKNLKNKTSYTVQVSALLDGELVGEGSSKGIPVGVPPRVPGVKATAGNAQVIITFNLLTTKPLPTTYQIQYWTNNDKNGKPILSRPITIKPTSAKKNVITYTLGKVTNGTVYHINISALNGQEVIALSSNVTATPIAPKKKKK